MFFFRNRKLKKGIRKLLKRAIDFGMAKDNLADINDFIDEGEYVCALHSIMYYLYEYDTKIDVDFYSEIESILSLMEMPIDTHAYMKEHITPPTGESI